MAQREQVIMPGAVSEKIDEILCKLNDGTYGNNGTKAGHPGFHMNWKKSVILAAALVMLVSATAVASVGALRERMEAMNREKIEEYFAQIYTAKIGHDNYNRPYTETEKERMEVLKASYENEACFPKGEIAMIGEAKDYKGRGVAFMGATATFFFPEEEMGDEELLRIIDFMYKRDYSLAKMNGMIEAGEAQMPEIAMPEPEATDEEILSGDRIYEPDQELTIPYTGELELDLTIAAGQNEIFLAGFNTVHRMAIGSSDSELFFDGFGVETRILAMCQDEGGDVYMALWQWLSEDAQERTLSVWVVDKDGELVRKVDLSPYLAAGRQGYTRRMAVDQNGYLYIKAAGLATTKGAAECEILVLDREGNYVNTISTDDYYMSLLGGLGVGKDGKVYTQIGNYYDPADSEQRLGIASVDVEKGTLGEIYDDIVPDNPIMIDIVAPGAGTDFVLWGYDGIFTYNLGDENAVNVLPAYEAPCDWEGVRACALQDGRIVFADCAQYRREETEYGTRFHGVPEKTCFYYVPGM